MIDNDKWAERYDTAAQDFLGEERVLAAVQMTRTGGYAAMAAGAFSGLGAIALFLRGKKKAGGLPQMFLLAVTEERIYALGTRGSFNMRATKELARWERDAVAISSEGVFNGTKVVITEADGDVVEVQGPPGELTDRVLAALGRVAVAA
jgi:hypothetical protein